MSMREEESYRSSRWEGHPMSPWQGELQRATLRGAPLLPGPGGEESPGAWFH